MTAVEWLEEQMFNLQIELKKERMPITKYESIKLELLEQAKEMEKQQIKYAFVECWKANAPDGIECKLDAEQYYNETFKSE